MIIYTHEGDKFMRISSIGTTPVLFKGDYENPVSRKTEKNLAVLGSIGGSATAGIIGAGITTLFTQKGAYKLPALVGAVVAAVGLALTLPSALYQAKVGSFTREKEMDVFSRERSAATNIFEGIDGQIQNGAPLEQTIDNYMKAQMGNKGNGTILVK